MHQENREGEPAQPAGSNAIIIQEPSFRWTRFIGKTLVLGAMIICAGLTVSAIAFPETRLPIGEVFGLAENYCIDADGDGFGGPKSVRAISASDNAVSKCGDRDDSDPAIYPGAPELCDGKDNDQDGAVDEGVRVPFLADKDGDGELDPGDIVLACCPPSGYHDPRFSVLDCDDRNPDMNHEDYDGDGNTTCDAYPDCDDRDPSLNMRDADADGLSTCMGDQDDTDPSIGKRDGSPDLSPPGTGPLTGYRGP